MLTSRHPYALRLAATGCFVALAAACSSSGHSSAATNAANTGSGAGSGAPAPAGAPSTGSDAKYCAALKVSDAQQLVKPTLSAAKTGGPRGCTFVLPGQQLNGDNITVTVFPRDNDKKYYDDQTTPFSGTTQAVSGDSDAVWAQVVPTAPPEVIAHHGSTTCVVQLPGDTTVLTIVPHGAPGLAAATPDDVSAYATKLAALCTDVFSVGS